MASVPTASDSSANKVTFAQQLNTSLQRSLEQAINEKSKWHRCGAPIPATRRDSVSTPEL